MVCLEKEYDPNNASRISHLNIEFENYKMIDGVDMGERIHGCGVTTTR